MAATLFERAALLAVEHRVELLGQLLLGEDEPAAGVTEGLVRVVVTMPAYLAGFGCNPGGDQPARCAGVTSCDVRAESKARQRAEPRQ